MRWRNVQVKAENAYVLMAVKDDNTAIDLPGAPIV